MTARARLVSSPPCARRAADLHAGAYAPARRATV
jgi:hypothetical protein